jgi:hypothetical protein
VVEVTAPPDESSSHDNQAGDRAGQMLSATRPPFPALRAPLTQPGDDREGNAHELLVFVE